jgi:glycosyltransferase involved in cell wall biosynthesis
MKIAIFTNNYLPNPYGVTVSVETLCTELERRGHTVYIFAPRWKDYSDKNSNIFRYPSIDIEFKFRFPLPFPYSWRMCKILQKMEIDIIHSQHPNLLGYAASRWARKKNIPLIFTWHTLYDKYTNFVPFLPKKWLEKKIITQAVKYANRTDAVIAPTDSIIAILKKWGVKQQIFSISTGIKKTDFLGADRKMIRQKYQIDDDEIVLLLVSRLTEEKNIEFIFRALKNILKENRKIKFLVAGDGYLLPKLKKFCEENSISEQVIFSGLISRAEIKNYYACSDIFVYASKSETQGIIPLEAMYSKLPIVAIFSTGISSLMLDRGNGFLVHDNENDFAQAVIKLVEDKKMRERFGAVSGRIARENFTSEVCAEKMLKVYEMCLNH